MKESMKKILGKDGKAVILGLENGMQGRFDIDNPGRVLKDASDAGIDGAIVTYGLVKHFRDCFGDAGIILKVDAFPTLLAPMEQDEIPDTYFDAQDAYDMGIQGIMTDNYVGRKIGDKVIDVESQKVMTRLAQQADRLGMTYISCCMAYNKSPVVNDKELQKKIRTVEDMKVACRIPAEMGADAIKAHCPGPEFKEVLKNTYIPVFGIVSPEYPDEKRTLELARNVMDYGCAGITVGNYVFHHPNMKGLLIALNAIVHGGASVDEAMKLL